MKTSATSARLKRLNRVERCVNFGTNSMQVSMSGWPSAATPQSIRDLGRKGQHVAKPQDLLKDPYVLEFLGLE
jgi:hypothetical protein